MPVLVVNPNVHMIRVSLGCLLGNYRPVESITQVHQEEQHKVEQVSSLPPVAEQLPPEMGKMVTDTNLSECEKEDLRAAR